MPRKDKKSLRIWYSTTSSKPLNTQSQAHFGHECWQHAMPHLPSSETRSLSGTDGRGTAGRPVTWTHHIQTQQRLTQQKKPCRSRSIRKGKDRPGISYRRHNAHTVISHGITLKEILMFAVSGIKTDYAIYYLRLDKGLKKMREDTVHCLNLPVCSIITSVGE